jgi:CRISPR system Cascade subunit CasD
VCLWETGKYSLDTIAKAMANPVYTPFLGRKSCLLGLPFNTEIITVKNLKEAYEKYIPDRSSALSSELFQDNPRVFWEGSDTSLKVVAHHARRDLLKCRRTWAYNQRTEYEGRMERRPLCIKAA